MCRLPWSLRVVSSLHFQIECRPVFQSMFSLMSWLLVEFSRAPFLVDCFHLRSILLFLLERQLLGNPLVY